MFNFLNSHYVDSTNGMSCKFWHTFICMIFPVAISTSLFFKNIFSGGKKKKGKWMTGILEIYIFKINSHIISDTWKLRTFQVFFQL